MLAKEMGRKMNKYVEDYVIFDLETTGVSYKKDEVIEISAIKVIKGEVVDKFSTLVDPGIPIPYYATEVNNITDNMVKGAPSMETALKDFLDFCGDMILVGHNIHCFDMKFICRDALKYFGYKVGNDYIDTLPLARMCLPTLPHHTLTALAEYYELNTEGAHRALNDCRMNQIIFENLGKELEQIAESKKGLMLCPVCGNQMVLRKGKFGAFFGCSGYPTCRYIINSKR